MSADDVWNLIRTVILLLGVTLAMLCVRFSYLAIRNGEAYRAWGLASYACLVLTPAFIGINNYDEKIVIPAAVLYLGGIICGFLALRTTVHITPEWVRLRAAESARKRKARVDD